MVYLKTKDKMYKGKLTRKTLSLFAAYVLAIGFLLFYFSDGLGKIIERNDLGFHRYSAIFKGLMEIFFLLYGCFLFTKQKISVLIIMLTLFSCFLVGQYFLSINYPELNFFENFNTLFKYFLPLILYLAVTDIVKLNKRPNIIPNSYRLIIGINSILIIVGFIFSIEFLSTYSGPWRFGYDGLVFAQNEASFIFIIAISLFYYRRFYQGIKELLFWVVLLTSLIVATKAVYLYLILLLFFHLFKNVPLKKLVTYFVTFGILGYLLFSTIINKIVLNSLNVFLNVYRKDGLITALLSGRNIYFEKKIFPLIFEYWQLPNLLIGGQDVTAFYSEMGFIDVFLFFGIIGTILYLYVFYKLFMLLNFQKDFKIFFGVCLSLIIATAGHFFESGIATIHFVFLIIMVNSYTKNISKKT